MFIVPEHVWASVREPRNTIDTDPEIVAGNFKIMRVPSIVFPDVAVVRCCNAANDIPLLSVIDTVAIGSNSAVCRARVFKKRFNGMVTISVGETVDIKVVQTIRIDIYEIAAHAKLHIII